MSDLKRPTEQLPKPGQRVRVICIKEMIFNGDGKGGLGQPKDNDSEWLDDGQGERGIMFWEEIE